LPWFRDPPVAMFNDHGMVLKLRDDICTGGF
jgi:hypothetical protein